MAISCSQERCSESGFGKADLRFEILCRPGAAWCLRKRFLKTIEPGSAKMVRIRERLNVHSRQDAVAVAMMCGWIRGRGSGEGDSVDW